MKISKWLEEYMKSCPNWLILCEMQVKVTIISLFCKTWDMLPIAARHIDSCLIFLQIVGRNMKCTVIFVSHLKACIKIKMHTPLTQ